MTNIMAKYFLGLAEVRYLGMFPLNVVIYCWSQIMYSIMCIPIPDNTCIMHAHNVLTAIGIVQTSMHTHSQSNLWNSQAHMANIFLTDSVIQQSSLDVCNEFCHILFVILRNIKYCINGIWIKITPFLKSQIQSLRLLQFCLSFCSVFLKVSLLLQTTLPHAYTTNFIFETMV